MVVTRSYYCGERGVVRRLDNLTGQWLVKDVPNQQLILNDIMTSPTNGDLVFTVGSNNAIFRSVDAGDNWTTPGGGYLAFPPTQWHEVWVIDDNNIVVCGSEGRIAISTDGGLNFGIPSNLPTPTGLPVSGTSARAIHFTSPTTGVVGFEDRVFKTTDGGNTWTLGTVVVTSPPPIVGSNPPVIINGIHLDQSGQVIVVHGNTNIWRSVNGGLTFIPVYNYVHTIFIHPTNVFIYNGQHLTWYDDLNLWGTGDFGEIVRSTNGGATWTLLRTNFTLPSPTFSSNKAAHFYKLLSGVADGFWNNNAILNSTPDSGLTGIYSDTSLSDINAVWTQLHTPPCYKLLNCGGKPIPIIVNDNLAQYVGYTVQIDGECFEVELSDTCQGAITFFPNGVPQLPIFSSCVRCNPPDCFELVDCTGQTPVLIFSYQLPGPGIDLSQFEGQIIKLCSFLSSPVLSLNHPTNLICPVSPSTSVGFVTQVTGPTTGFFYQDSSGTVLPYSNPSAFPVVPGTPGCFTVAGPPHVLNTASTTVVFQIQFFVGTTAITNPIPVTTLTTQAALQFFINANIIDPAYTITVNYFNFAGLNVNIVTNTAITATEVTVTITPDFNGQTSTTAEITGACICYTVTNIGPCEFEILPPPPLEQPIVGCFPDCECCLPPPPPDPEPPYVPTPPEIDKGTYVICESACDINANTTFASAMYDIFKQKQYGITSCCNINLSQVWIKKMLSDLSKIKC